MKFVPTPVVNQDPFKDIKNNIMFPLARIEPNEKIKNFNVNLTFINSKIYNGEYTFNFLNTISSNEQLLNPNIIINASKIDVKDLQQKIMNTVDKKDLKYIKLKFFNTSRSVFVFDINSWLKDALYNVQGRVFLSKFDKEFRLRIQPPTMIRYYGIRLDFQRYVGNYFKEYAKKNPQTRNVLFNIIPKSFENTIKTHVSNMFDYEYDFQSNRIIVRLKPVYITGLVVGAFTLSDKVMKQNNFNDMVKKNISYFPKDKIGSKFF